MKRSHLVCTTIAFFIFSGVYNFFEDLRPSDLDYEVGFNFFIAMKIMLFLLFIFCSIYFSYRLVSKLERNNSSYFKKYLSYVGAMSFSQVVIVFLLAFHATISSYGKWKLYISIAEENHNNKFKNKVVSKSNFDYEKRLEMLNKAIQIANEDLQSPNAAKYTETLRKEFISTYDERRPSSESK